MKVLIVAPRLCTPWTEGRKKLIRDLISATGQRWQLCGLVTLDPGETTALPPGFEMHVAHSRKDHLLLLVGRLREAIAAHKPDLVCHFPFGAFTGLRGIANLWAIAAIERICRKAAVKCCTLMYSLTAEADSALHRYLLRNVHFNQYAGMGRRVRFGVLLQPGTGDALYDARARHLLFMSGAAESTAASLDYVLDVRGLRYLLRAGERLSPHGFRVTVAVPFLRDATMLEHLREHPDNTWHADNIRFLPEVRIPDVFSGMSAFVFPYGQEEKQFVPTSVVEAMHFGIPVVLPCLDFLSQFMSSPAKALVHTPRDVVSLTEQILCLGNGGEDIDAMRRRAAVFVDTEYDIGSTVQDIEALYAAAIADSRRPH